jgi:hypothetical protein
MREAMIHIFYTEAAGIDWKQLYPDAVLHQIDIPVGKEEEQALSIVDSIMRLESPPRVGDTVIVIAGRSVPLFEHTCIQVIQKRFEETVEAFILEGSLSYKIPYVRTHQDKTPRDSPMVLYNYKDGCGSCGKC